MVNCAGCKSNGCYQGEDCSRGQEFSKFKDSSRREYLDPSNLRILEVAANIEAEHYMQWTRLEEVISFAEQMAYQKIGIAHCLGFTSEARQLKNVLSQKFELEAIGCKFTGIDKKDFNLT